MSIGQSTERRHILITALLLIAAACITSRPAHADLGQCRYEGGPGAPTYPSCLNLDCLGNGGYAQCTEPEPRVSNPFTESDADGEKFVYHICPANTLDMGGFCVAAGGTWHGFNVSPSCSGLPPGYILSNPLLTTTEQLAIATADAYAALLQISDGTGGYCAQSSPSDTGWGTNIGFSNCWGGGPRYLNGLLYSDVRQKVYHWAGPCSSFQKQVEFLKQRSISCPTSYHTRSKPNGDLQCFKPADQCADRCGNPVSLTTGAKYQEETDYLGIGAGGPTFTRLYSSEGFFRLPGTLSSAAKADDYWRHNYQIELLPVSGSASLMAIRRGADSRLEYYDSAGKEMLNQAGAANRLETTLDGGWKLTRANHDVERFDSNGRLISIMTREGLLTTLNYDVLGRLSSIVGAFGHGLTLTYNTDGRVQSVTLPDNSLVQYQYDGKGRMETATYPDQTVRRYHYEDPKRLWLLSGITDESAARFSTYTYDDQGRVSISEHAGGAERFQFSYGGTTVTSSNTSAVDPLGNNHGIVANTQAGVLKKSYDYRTGAGTGSKDQHLDYDAQGNVSRRRQFPIGPSGTRYETTYEYDLTRNLEISRTEGRTSSGTTAVTRTITTQWHSAYRLPTLITEPNRTTAFTHDASGNVLTKTVTDTSVTPNISRVWAWTYDSYGRVLTENGPRTDISDVTTYTYYTCTTGAQCGQLETVTNALNQTTTYSTYNAHGQPLTIADPNGIVTTLTYDARQRLTSRTVAGESTTLEYWPTGLLKKLTQPDGSFLLYTYDAAHRLTQISDGLGNSESYVLDAMGNRQVENQYDPYGALVRARAQLFNALGQLWKELTAAGTEAQATVFGYDNNGNLTTVNAPLSRTTTNVYDELNRLKQMTDPALGNTAFAYDAHDNLTQVTDPRGLITSYQYSAFGEVKQQSSPDTGTTANTFDSGGNLQTSTNARGAITTHTYDALNRVTSSAFQIGSTTDQTITYTYDAGTNGKGRLTSASDANHALSWVYDAQGRVTSKSQTVGGVVKSVTYGYTSGNLTSIVTPSGQSVTYSYNTNRQVTGVSVNGSVLLSNVLYEPFGPSAGWTWSNGTLTVRSFDTDGRLDLIDSAGLSTYTFYDDGRISGITRDTASAYTLANGTTSTTIAASSNRITSTAGTLTRSYTYDAAGNVTGFGGVSFTYNFANRMSSATQGGVTTNYVLNALGERIRKSSSTGTTIFVYDEAGHLLGEYNGAGQLVQETVWLGDIPVATLRPNGSGGVNVFYVHTDHLNTPRRVTRPSDNAVIWRWNSDPFGAAAANQDPDGDAAQFVYHLRFPGQYYDSETGLHQNYFRDYDSATGRYVQSDPIGLNGGLNTYLYADANPISVVDPQGLLGYWPARPPKPGAGWPMCDGRDGVTIQMPILPPKMQKCIGDCVRQHEISHIVDLRRADRTVCRGRTRGEIPTFDTMGELNASERRAYDAELACLRAKLQGLSDCDECKPVIRERIRQIPGIRGRYE